MDQPFLTAGFLSAAFVGCLVSVGAAAAWPLVPAVVCALIGSVLLGFASIGKPLLLDRLLKELAVAPAGVNAEVRWAQGRVALVATTTAAGVADDPMPDGPHRVTAEAGTFPLRPGCAVALVEVGALRDGDPAIDLVALLAPESRLRAVEARPGAARLTAALTAAGFTVDQHRTWLTCPPSQVVRASRTGSTRAAPSGRQ